MSTKVTIPEQEHEFNTLADAFVFTDKLNSFPRTVNYRMSIREMEITSHIRVAQDPKDIFDEQ